MNEAVDVSAIVIAHNEAAIAVIAWRSAVAACQAAEARGLSTETIVVLDRPDTATERCFSDPETVNTRRILADYGDLSQSRNLGVAHSRGRFVALLDGDDLWSSGWLWRAFACANAAPRTIWHPALNLFFGAGADWVLAHEDQDSAEFDLDYLVAANFWTSLAFAPRDAFVSIPYQPNDLEHGFGLEDWHWNCETIANGWIHKTVPETVHFIRENQSGLTNRTATTGGVVRPTTLFSRPRPGRMSSSCPCGSGPARLTGGPGSA